MIEILGTFMGIMGAVLNCQPPGQFRKATFYCWLPSNVLMLAWSASISAWWVAGLYSVYVCTSAWGLYRS
jgi:hypothetical protein